LEDPRAQQGAALREPTPRLRALVADIPAVIIVQWLDEEYARGKSDAS
jgi:hypothetical protein